MIKKLKIGLLIAVLSLFAVAGHVFAAAGDLTWSVDQIISLSSPTTINLNIDAVSTASSLVVNTGTVVPTLAAGDVFHISTVAAGNFTVSPSTGVNKMCNPNATSTVTITATGTQAYTITPSTTPCSTSGGGGGGGSGGARPPTVPPVSDQGCSGTNQYNASTGALCINNIGPTAHGLYKFGTAILRNGSRGDAVKELQRFLNATMNLGLVVDGKLGPKTIAVIKKWQKAHDLVADGLVGPKTKAKMNASVQ